MFKCFVCSKRLESVKEILKHFKDVHKLKNYGVFKCCQRNCFQHFSSKYSFAKHLNLHHEKDENLNISCELNNGLKASVESMSNFSGYVENNDETLNNVNLNFNFSNEIHKSALVLTSGLYAKENFSRKDALHIQSKITNFCQLIVSNVRSCISNPTQILEILNIVSNPFKNVQTEHTYTQHLIKNDMLEPFYAYTVNNETAEKNAFGRTILRELKSEAYVFRLRFNIRKIFEIDTLLTDTLKNMDVLEKSKNYSNFVNGSLYKEKKAVIGDDKLIIPYFLYADDFEVNNPLGSRNCKDSMCGIYLSFPTIPDHLISNLNFIFVASLCKSSLMKAHGSNKTLYALKEEIRHLEEEGIKINSSGSTYHVYFVLGLILGDNLGIKIILGFSKSFSSNKYCRLCSRGKEDMQKDGKEYISFLRNEDNYKSDLETNNTKETGISEKSIFNEIKSFHVTSNYSADIMHDIFEGVCRYELSKSILYFLEKKFFTLDFLNMRIRVFPYGELEVKVPCPLTLVNLKNGNIRMTASETKTFLHLFPLIIGDKVPRNDKVWKLVTFLVKITDLCLLSSLSDENLENLQKNIFKHHKLYVKCFGKLKPKHHFMVHYASIIKMAGPLRKMWCMRFEAKHKSLKKYMNIITSRRNGAYSLAKKVSFQFSNFLLTYRIEPEFKHNMAISYEEISERIKTFLQLHFDLKNLILLNEVLYKGTSYKKNFYLCLYLNEKLHVHKIEYLAIGLDKKVYVISSEIEVHSFDEHYQAFLTKKNTKALALNEIKFFNSFPLNIHTMFNGSSYIRLKPI